MRDYTHRAYVECPHCGQVLSEPVEANVAPDGITLFSYTEDEHQVTQRFGTVVAVHCPGEED
jgi:hypothetical protein